MDIVELKWNSGKGVQTTFDMIAEEVSGNPVYIGTDSQRHGRKFTFTTAVCLEEDGKIRRYFFVKQRLQTKNFKSLHERLLYEVQLSLDVANGLMGFTNKYEPEKYTIHVDVSDDDSAHKSGRSAIRLSNYVKAYGFNCEIKPNAWAAAAVADKHAR